MEQIDAALNCSDGLHPSHRIKYLAEKGILSNNATVMRWALEEIKRVTETNAKELWGS